MVVNMTTTKNLTTKTANIHYGDVVQVDLGMPYGSEQGGVRPAIVISNDKNNLHSPVVNVVLISSSGFKRNNKSYLPIHVPISPKDVGVSGLDLESVIICEQPKSIDKSRIKYKRGHIDSQYIINAINKAIMVQYNMA